MHRYPQIALGYSLERLMFVVHLCYFNEGCKVVASNVLHNTVRVSLYAYFDLLLICVADASPHFFSYLLRLSCHHCYYFFREEDEFD